MLCGSLVDILAGLVATHEGDSLDVLVLADLLSGLEASLDDIEDTLGKSDLLSEFSKVVDCACDSF